MGWSTQAVIAQQVIIQGSNDGLFVYNGTPAAGNLIASIAPAAGTDQYGNPYQSGITSYDNSAGPPAAYLQTLARTLTNFPGGSGGANGQMLWSAGLINLQTPTISGPDTACIVQLRSALESADGTSPEFIIQSRTQAQNPIFAMDPANPGNDEILHSFPAFTNSWTGGGRAANRYRIVASPANAVELVGSLTVPAGFASGQVITSPAFPASYRPASPQSIPAHDTTNDNTVWLGFGTAGNLTFQGPVASTAATHVLDFHGFISLTA